MSIWKEVKDEDVYLSDNGKTIEILYDSDDQGNYWIEISTEKVKQLLNEFNKK